MKKPAAPRSKARPTAVRARAAKTAAATAPASPLAAEGAEAKKKRTNPVQFIVEVRAEARKITWTSRKETVITSIMVGIMVVMTAVFFFVVDLGLSAGISGILRLAAPAQ
jgi:preprotein translocase subunit SecE